MGKLFGVLGGGGGFFLCLEIACQSNETVNFRSLKAAIFLQTAGSSPVLFCFTPRRVEIWHFESLGLLLWKSQRCGPCDLLSSLIPSSTQSSSAPEAFQVLSYTSSSLLRGLLCQFCLEHAIPWR